MPTASARNWNGACRDVPTRRPAGDVSGIEQAVAAPPDGQEPCPRAATAGLSESAAGAPSTGTIRRCLQPSNQRPDDAGSTPTARPSPIRIFPACRRALRSTVAQRRPHLLRRRQEPHVIAINEHRSRAPRDPIHGASEARPDKSSLKRARPRAACRRFAGRYGGPPSPFARYTCSAYWRTMRSVLNTGRSERIDARTRASQRAGMPWASRW